MESTNTAPQSADAASKKRATPKNSPPLSSSTNGSGNKRQRLSFGKSTEERPPTADFISLDFSDGDGEEEVLETIGKISESASLDSIMDGNENLREEEEGGLKEKTSKRKRRTRGRGRRKLKESDLQSGQDVKDQLGRPNLTGEGNSSDEEGNVRVVPTNGSISSEDVYNESEEEDKDSFTRRALQAKMTNGAQTPVEGQNEQNPQTVETVETVAAAAAAKSETDSTGLSNGTTLPAGEDLKEGKAAVEDGIEAAAPKKNKDKEKKRKEKGKQRKDLRAAKKERRDKVQIDLPKGGDFSSLPDNSEVVGFSDVDDEGIEINVDMDMDDFELQQEEQLGEKQAEAQLENRSDGEEGEVDESPENGDVTSGDESESSGSGNESPLLDQISAFKQRKYYTAFALPPFEQVEARPYFSDLQTPDFKLDMVRERKLVAPHRIKESRRICSVCTKVGHSEDKCEYLKCKYCEKWNEHFSHACPDAPSDDEPRIKDKWRYIPTHLHKTTSPFKLRIACYHCGGIDHFGDDCPHIPPLPVPGSFSLTDINTCGYASQDWLLTFSDKLDDLTSRRATGKYGPAGTKGTVMPAPDPFQDYRKLDETPLQPPPPVAPRGRGRNGGGGKGENMYRLDRAPRGPGRAPQGAQYHVRSPVRSEIFDRYRGPPPPPPRQPHGLPPRPRSRSPPRYRSGGGGRGGGEPRGGNPYRPPSDPYDRPAHGGGRGGYGGDPGRVYESRTQPPLPNEPLPRSGGSRSGGGRANYRPAPSNARGNRQKYKS